MASFKFPKSKRLLKRADFDALKGTRLKISAFGLFIVAKPNELVHPRLGLAIAKRFVKRSVYRNKIKRIVRESFRHKSQSLPNLDIILLVNASISTVDIKELHQCLDNVWDQLINRAKHYLS